MSEKQDRDQEQRGARPPVEHTHQQGEQQDESERLAPAFSVEDEAAELARGVDPTSGWPEGEKTQSEGLVGQLAAEVKRLRERLQHTTEEYESAYEELETLNAELKDRLEELSRAHSDLENLMASTEIATLFLDGELCIRRYTPQTTSLFNILERDHGRPVGHLTNRLQYDGLVEDAEIVLHESVQLERELQDVDGRWFLARLCPYHTVNTHMDGVVLTFVEITELKQTEAALRQEKEYREKIVDTVREGLLVLTPDLRVEFANESFYEIFQVAEAETLGTRIYNLGNNQWDIPELRTLLEEILPEENQFNNYRVEHVFETMGRRVMRLNGRRLDQVRRILLVIEEVTAQEEDERDLSELNETLEERVQERTAALRESEERYQALVATSAQMVWTTDADGLMAGESASWHAFTGQSREEYQGWGWLNVVHPEDRIYAASNWATHVENQIPAQGEFRMRHASGEWRWTNVRAVPLYDDAAEIRGWVGMCSDITERRQAEQEAQALAAQLTMAEQEERARIAQILHDDLQQQLYAMQIRLSLLKEEVTDGSLIEEMVDLEEAVAAAKQTTRQLSVDLSPPILEGEGLTEAIRWLSTQMQEQYGLVVELAAEGSFPVPQQDRRVLLFQMVRELLFNAAKHAGVSRVAVRLEQISGAYRIDIEDRGVGFDPTEVLDPEAIPEGRGLVHTRERLRLIGGRLEVQSTPGEGTRVAIVVPPTAG